MYKKFVLIRFTSCHDILFNLWFQCQIWFNAPHWAHGMRVNIIYACLDLWGQYQRIRALTKGEDIKIKKRVSHFSLQSFISLLLLFFPDFLCLTWLEGAFISFKIEVKYVWIAANYKHRFNKSSHYILSRNYSRWQNLACSRMILIIS